MGNSSGRCRGWVDETLLNKVPTPKQSGTHGQDVFREWSAVSRFILYEVVLLTWLCPYWDADCKRRANRGRRSSNCEDLHPQQSLRQKHEPAGTLPSWLCSDYTAFLYTGIAGNIQDFSSEVQPNTTDSGLSIHLPAIYSGDLTRSLLTHDDQLRSNNVGRNYWHGYIS